MELSQLISYPSVTTVLSTACRCLCSSFIEKRVCQHHGRTADSTSRDLPRTLCLTSSTSMTAKMIMVSLGSRDSTFSLTASSLSIPPREYRTHQRNPSSSLTRRSLGVCNPHHHHQVCGDIRSSRWHSRLSLRVDHTHKRTKERASFLTRACWVSRHIMNPERPPSLEYLPFPQKL